MKAEDLPQPIQEEAGVSSGVACWHVADVPGVQGELLPAGV